MYRLLLCLPFLLLLAACGDDDASTPDAGNPMDQCLGTADRAILDPLLIDGGTGIAPEFEDILLHCGQDVCSNEVLSGDHALAESCMHDCYSTTSIAGLSTGCERCWTGSVLCAAEFCPIVCLGTDEAACLACVSTNCDQTSICTGI